MATVQVEVTRSSTFVQPTADKNDKKLMKTCHELESVFFGMMLKEMRKTIPQSTLVGDSQHEQEIFTEMMDQNISEKMADTDSADNGLAGMLYRQLSGKRAYEAMAGQSMPGSNMSSEQAAQSAEERKGKIIHETRSFPITIPGHYPVAQVRAHYPAAASRTPDRAAIDPVGR
jgi:flagellar protein FlgJ